MSARKVREAQKTVTTNSDRVMRELKFFRCCNRTNFQKKR